MANTQAQIIVFSAAITGSPEFAPCEDNCMCDGKGYAEPLLHNEPLFQSILTSFDPREIKTISDFVHLSDSAKRNQGV